MSDADGLVVAPAASECVAVSFPLPPWARPGVVTSLRVAPFPPLACVW